VPATLKKGNGGNLYVAERLRSNHKLYNADPKEECAKRCYEDHASSTFTLLYDEYCMCASDTNLVTENNAYTVSIPSYWGNKYCSDKVSKGSVATSSSAYVGGDAQTCANECAKKLFEGKLGDVDITQDTTIYVSHGNCCSRPTGCFCHAQTLNGQCSDSANQIYYSTYTLRKLSITAQSLSWIVEAAKSYTIDSNAFSELYNRDKTIECANRCMVKFPDTQKIVMDENNGCACGIGACKTIKPAEGKKVYALSQNPHDLATIFECESQSGLEMTSVQCKCGDDAMCSTGSYCSAAKYEYLQESGTVCPSGTERVTSYEECSEAIKNMKADVCSGKLCKTDKVLSFWTASQPVGCYWNQAADETRSNGWKGLATVYMRHRAPSSNNHHPQYRLQKGMIGGHPRDYKGLSCTSKPEIYTTSFTHGNGKDADKVFNQQCAHWCVTTHLTNTCGEDLTGIMAGTNNKCYCAYLQSHGTYKYVSADYTTYDLVFDRNDRAICRNKVEDIKPVCLETPRRPTSEEYYFAKTCDIPIKTFEECIAAIKMTDGSKYLGVTQVNWWTEPTGCFRMHNNAYFNSHATGTPIQNIAGFRAVGCKRKKSEPVGLDSNAINLTPDFVYNFKEGQCGISKGQYLPSRGYVLDEQHAFCVNGRFPMEGFNTDVKYEAGHFTDGFDNLFETIYEGKRCTGPGQGKPIFGEYSESHTANTMPSGAHVSQHLAWFDDLGNYCGANSGDSYAGYPCKQNNIPNCWGDCDNDGQCAAGLKCFQRDGNEMPPTCHGSETGYNGYDYCYDPNGPRVRNGNPLRHASNFDVECARRCADSYPSKNLDGFYRAYGGGTCTCLWTDGCSSTSTWDTDATSPMPPGFLTRRFLPETKRLLKTAYGTKRISKDHPLYDPDPNTECMNRCLAAYPDTKYFYVTSGGLVPENECVCATSSCTDRKKTDSPVKIYKIDAGPIDMALENALAQEQGRNDKSVSAWTKSTDFNSQEKRIAKVKTWTKKFDGECATDATLTAVGLDQRRMYAGLPSGADGPTSTYPDGTTAAQATHQKRVDECAKACQRHYPEYRGFFVRHQSQSIKKGRCYCEHEPSATCTRSVSTDYERWDFVEAVNPLDQGCAAAKWSELMCNGDDPIQLLETREYFKTNCRWLNHHKDTYAIFDAPASGQTSCAANGYEPITTAAECLAAGIALSNDVDGVITTANWANQIGYCFKWGGSTFFNPQTTSDKCGHTSYLGNPDYGPCICKKSGSTYGCVPKEEGAQTDGVHLADLYTGCMEATGVSNDFKRTSIIEDVPMTGAGAKTCMEKCKVAGFSNMILYCPNVAPDGSHRVHCSCSILVGAQSSKAMFPRTSDGRCEGRGNIGTANGPVVNPSWYGHCWNSANDNVGFGRGLVDGFRFGHGDVRAFYNIEAFQTEGNTVKVAVKVTSSTQSSDYGSYSSSRAFDNDFGTYSHTALRTNGHWIQANLVSGIKKISRVDIYNKGTGDIAARLKNFKIEYQLTSSTSWEKCSSESGTFTDMRGYPCIVEDPRGIKAVRVRMEPSGFKFIRTGECNTGDEWWKSNSLTGNEAERAEKCAALCRKTNYRGFIISPTGGCYCESANSKTCGVDNDSWRRYDFNNHYLHLREMKIYQDARVSSDEAYDVKFGYCDTTKIQTYMGTPYHVNQHLTWFDDLGTKCSGSGTSVRGYTCKQNNIPNCWGDCDNDGQCASGLKCFQRNGNEMPPSCAESTGTSGGDYCYDPGKPRNVDWQTCADRCKNTDGCIAFRWYSYSGINYCDLAGDNCDNPITSGPHWHSYILRESPTNGYRGYCTDVLAGHPKYTSGTLATCKADCDAAGALCLGYSYQHDDTHQCILSSTSCMEENQYEENRYSWRRYPKEVPEKLEVAAYLAPLTQVFGSGVTKYPVLPEDVVFEGCGHCASTQNYFIPFHQEFGDLGADPLPVFSPPLDAPFVVDNSYHTALTSIGHELMYKQCAQVCALSDPTRPFGFVRTTDRICYCSAGCNGRSKSSSSQGEKCTPSSAEYYASFKAAGRLQQFSRPVPPYKPINWIISKGSMMKVTGVHMEVKSPATCAQFCAADGCKWFRHGGVGKFADMCTTMAPGTMKTPQFRLTYNKAYCKNTVGYNTFLSESELTSLRGVSRDHMRDHWFYEWARKRTREGCARHCYARGHTAFFVQFDHKPISCSCAKDSCDVWDTASNTVNVVSQSCCRVFHITEPKTTPTADFYNDKAYEWYGLRGYYMREYGHHWMQHVNPSYTNPVTGVADLSRDLGRSPPRLPTSDVLYDLDPLQECANRCAAAGWQLFFSNAASSSVVGAFSDLCSACGTNDLAKYWDASGLVSSSHHNAYVIKQVAGVTGTYEVGPTVTWREKTKSTQYKDCSSTRNWESNNLEYKSFSQSLSKSKEPEECKCGENAFCTAEEDCLETKDGFGGSSSYECKRRIMPEHLQTLQTGHTQVLATIPERNVEFWNAGFDAEEDVCRCGTGYGTFCRPSQTCFTHGNEALCGDFLGPDNAVGFSTTCPQGKYSPTLDQAIDCLDCPAGYFSGIGASKCTACAAGTYSDTTGASSTSSCKKCPQGYFSNKCETVEEGLFMAIKESEFVNGYRSLGDGSCTNVRFLPEGEFPPLLPADHPLYDANRIKECRNRCRNAYPDSFTFFVKTSDENRCACNENNCETVPSPALRSKKGRITWKGWSPAKRPLGQCEGDCDSDGDCAGDMKCKQINWWPSSLWTNVVDDCSGLRRRYADYCYLPQHLKSDDMFTAYEMMGDGGCSREGGQSMCKPCAPGTFSPADDEYGRSVCYACSVGSLDVCPLCGFTDGTTLNTGRCGCGGKSCKANSYCFVNDLGGFCNTRPVPKQGISSVGESGDITDLQCSSSKTSNQITTTTPTMYVPYDVHEGFVQLDISGTDNEIWSAYRADIDWGDILQIRVKSSLVNMDSPRNYPASWAPETFYKSGADFISSTKSLSLRADFLYQYLRIFTHPVDPRGDTWHGSLDMDNVHVEYLYEPASEKVRKYEAYMNNEYTECYPASGQIKTKTNPSPKKWSASYPDSLYDGATYNGCPQVSFQGEYDATNTHEYAKPKFVNVCGDIMCVNSYCQYLNEEKTKGTCTQYLHSTDHYDKVSYNNYDHDPSWQSRVYHGEYAVGPCGKSFGASDNYDEYCIRTGRTTYNTGDFKRYVEDVVTEGFHYRCEFRGRCGDGSERIYDNPIFGGHLPLAVYSCDDALADVTCGSIMGDGKSSYNSGRWSTPGQVFCNTCKEGYEPTDLDRFKLMSPDYAPSEHIECSPCLYNEGTYSDTAGIRECKKMNGCSRGHKFVHQTVMSYTVLRQYNKQKDVRFDFDGNAQRNAYSLKFKFPEYLRESSPGTIVLGGGCAACPNGYYSEVTDLSEDCKPKTKQCIGSYYPSCARSEDLNGNCRGSGIFSMYGESDKLYRECKNDMCHERMTFAVTDWDASGILSDNDHRNFECIDTMSELYNRAQTPTCSLIEGGVRDRECYPCPPGSYSDVLDAEQCTVCPVGKFQPGTGMDLTNCFECGAGTYQDQTGQTECKYCADSQTSVPGSIACTACAAGRYMSATNIAYVRRVTGWCKNPFHTYCFDPLIPKYSGQTWRNVPNDDKDFSDIAETCPFIKILPAIELYDRAKTRDILQADACANACRAYPGFIVHHAQGHQTDGRCYCTMKVHPNCDIEGVDTNVAGEWVTYAMGTADGAQPGCVECPAGKFSGVQDPLCNDCPARHFALPGAESCTPWTGNCPLGHEGLLYPTKTRDLLCHECAPGFFRNTLATVDIRDIFEKTSTKTVTQTDPTTTLPAGEFKAEFRFKLINEKDTINTCVFDTGVLPADQENSACPELTSYNIPVPNDIEFCPEGTHVYYNGARCCRNDVDTSGNPVKFTSRTCKDNNYEPCPAGANEGACSEKTDDFVHSNGVCVHVAYTRQKMQCSAGSVIPYRAAEDAQDCAYLCAQELKNNNLGLFASSQKVKHFASYTWKSGSGNACYCHPLSTDIGDCNLEEDAYQIVEIHTKMAGPSGLKQYGPTAGESDNYLPHINANKPSSRVFASHVTYFDITARNHDLSSEKCNDACTALNSKSIHMLHSKAYGYETSFQNKNIDSKPTMVNKGGSAHLFGDLGICEGDCDSDSHCAGNLICFQRGSNEPVPGCSGTFTSGWDVCVKPTPSAMNIPYATSYHGSAETLRFDNNGNTCSGTANGCSLHNIPRCRADCDSDSQCADGMFCHQKGSKVWTPGCSGSSSAPSDYDYCYDPEIYEPTYFIALGDSVQIVDRVQCFCSSLEASECDSASVDVSVEEMGLFSFESYSSVRSERSSCVEHGLAGCNDETKFRTFGGTHLEDVRCDDCPPGRFNLDGNAFDCETQRCQCLEDGIMTTERNCTKDNPSYCDVCFSGYEIVPTGGEAVLMHEDVPHAYSGKCCSKFSGGSFHGECGSCTATECLDMMCTEGYEDVNLNLTDGCEFKHCASWSIASTPTEVCASDPGEHHFDLNTLAYFIDSDTTSKPPNFQLTDDAILRIAKFIKLYYDGDWMGNLIQSFSSNIVASKTSREMYDSDIFVAVDACLAEDPVGGNCKIYGLISNFGIMPEWDVTKVTDMKNLFKGRKEMNADLSKWKTSSAVDMSGMFYDCTAFNADVSNWDVSSVRDMSSMFYSGRQPKVILESERDPVTERNVYTKVESYVKTEFDQNLNKWDVRSVMDMTAMFTNADEFDGQIGEWKTQSVRSFKDMFNNAQRFNCDISLWDMQSATDVSGMFEQSLFDQDISQWNFDKVINASRMFYHNANFNNGVPTMPRVLDLTSMFEGAASFNSPTYQVTEKYTKTKNMFKGATAFQANNVCEHPLDGPPSECGLAITDADFKAALHECLSTSLAGDCPESPFGVLSKWKTSKITNMQNLFAIRVAVQETLECYAFTGDISKWDTSNVEDMSGAFELCDFTLDLSEWNTSSIRNMENMFRRSTFNGDLSKWDVSSLNNAKQMFAHSQFNGDIKNWQVAALTDATEMFKGSTFEQALSKWKIHPTTQIANILDDTYIDKLQCIQDSNGKVDVTSCDGCLSDIHVPGYPTFAPDSVTTKNAYGFQVVKKIQTSDNSLDKCLAKCLQNPSVFNGAIYNSKTTCRYYAYDAVANGCTLGFCVDAYDIDCDTWTDKVECQRQKSLPLHKQPCFTLDTINVPGQSTVSMQNKDRDSTPALDIHLIHEINACPIRDIETVVDLYFEGVSPYGDISTWDVSQVTDLSDLQLAGRVFSGLPAIVDMSTWDVSSVTSMKNLFSSSGPGFVTTCATPAENSAECSAIAIKAGVSYQGTRDWSGEPVGCFTNGQYAYFNTHATGSTYLNRLIGCKSTVPSLGFGDLGDWDVSSVQTMEGMFARSVNIKGIDKWDMTSVSDATNMFKDNVLFDGNLVNWDLQNTDVTSMFSGATKWLAVNSLVNKVISTKVVDSNIHSLVQACLKEDMQGHCSNIMSVPMEDWDTSAITDMSGLFKNERTFNVNLAKWDVSAVENFSEMFYGCEFFNHNLPWTTSSATNMDKMFFGASEFNGLINSWDVSKVTTMKQMFYNAKRFTDDISGWSYRSGLDYVHFFTGANAFNDRFECVRYYMRSSGRCTDDPGGQYLRQSECKTAQNEIKPWGYTTPRYSWMPWSHRSSWTPAGCWWYPYRNYLYYNRYKQSRRSCSYWRRCFCKDPFGVTPSTCSPRHTIRGGSVPSIEQFELRKSVNDCLEEDPDLGECSNWAALSGLGTMPNWDVSKIKDMSRLFKDRRGFNVDVSAWDVSNVDNMQEMFMNAVDFSRDISGWNFKYDVFRKDMFENAKKFFLDCEETKCYTFFKQ
jgi:surface protein